MVLHPALLALALLCTATGNAFAQSQPSAKAVLPDIPLPLLQSLAYVDIAPARSLALSDGVYADRERMLRLEPALIAHGDLDGDGTRDAAVLLEERIGATTTIHLAAVVQRAGRVRNMASLRLGEDVQVRSLAIEERIATLSLLVMGEGDAASKPTLKMTLGLKLAGSELQLMRQIPRGRFTLEELAGTSWTLADSAHTITAGIARAEDGSLRFSGRGPCSLYAATLLADGSVRKVTRGPALATKRDCPPEAAAVEREFLARLGATAAIRFSFGRLALAESRGGTMLWKAE